MTGGMRQTDILTAAGLYTLQHNVARLKEDHDNAAWLGQQLQQASVEVVDQQTNMLFVHMPAKQVEMLKSWFAHRDVLLSIGAVTRIVTHLDVDHHALEQLVAP